MPLPAWASKMRDLFRSGSVAQFLLHGNVFDVIPHGDRQLSLKAFLDEAMFGAYDTVLHYDRSRGVRATRGADDWGAWLQQALGDANPISSTREPGVALELIDRYLLRTLNLAAIQRGSDAAGSGAANAGAQGRGHRRLRRVRRARGRTRRSSAARSPPTSSRCSAGPTTRRSCRPTSSPC